MAVHVTKQKPKSKEKKKQSLIFVFIILTFFLQFHEKKNLFTKYVLFYFHLHDSSLLLQVFRVL